MEVLDQIIPMSEAAERLNRKPPTLRLWIRQGRLQGRCLDGRLWAFDKREIDRLAEQLGDSIGA